MRSPIEEGNEMSGAQIVDKIKDEKLRKYLKEYSKYTNPSNLLGILDYLGVKINRGSIDAVIPQFIIDRKEIVLGAIVLNGELFELALIIHDNYLVFEMMEVGDVVLYKEKMEEEEKDEKA
jgi:hypothetical protein